MQKVVPVEISARHIHLSKEHLDILFGEGYELKLSKELSQPGEFKAEEKISIKTEGGEINDITIIGPYRSQTQVEISATDARRLDINPPIRISGDLRGSAPITIVGPKGKVEINEGVIIAARHIHCDPTTASTWQLKDGQTVLVEVAGERSVIFKNVVVRVRPNFKLAFHVDTDEGNAAIIGSQNTTAVIV